MNSILRFLALVIVAGFCIGSAFAEGPKSYRIVINDVCKVGETEFQPGEYKVTVDGSSKVRFTAVRTGKSIEVDGNVESSGSKFDHTAISSKVVDGVSRLSTIQIGGSKTQIAFE
ncbi:MAG TPA: hypothetical protein VGL72_05490 [Bryobacteraceae bacterium]|jgi:hypothetical protein